MLCFRTHIFDSGTKCSAFRQLLAELWNLLERLVALSLRESRRTDGGRRSICSPRIVPGPDFEGQSNSFSKTWDAFDAHQSMTG